MRAAAVAQAAQLAVQLGKERASISRTLARSPVDPRSDWQAILDALGLEIVSILKGIGHGPLPPMLEQYVRMRDEVEAELPNTILLFQVGEMEFGNSRR
ncbi:hypothetical protein [Deinococcus sp. YIM 77859]|uniref:hypothetical protein n=1 Tax=Deinococcus sp. YIM 77859 TaxID=1540221 RepID=UPI00054E3A30|nr:hypothetical protein [Deinococcus sp. YIM 77859]